MDLKQIYAIAVKETKVNLRFKYDYFLSQLINPIRMLITFVIVYGGFFSAGATGLGNVKEGDYILFLLLGTLVYTLFLQGYSLFNTSMLREKYWRTIQALLIAPVSRIDLIIAYGLAELVRLILVLPLFLAMAYLLKPISLISLAFAALVILLMFLGIVGFSLIYGAFTLTNENYTVPFNYFFWFWGFMSCFYYPLEALPRIIQPLVLLNPIYHGLFIIQGLWMFGYVSDVMTHLAVVASFAVLTPLLSAIIFNKLIAKYGVTGY